jgi:hypothetical protein
MAGPGSIGRSEGRGGDEADKLRPQHPDAAERKVRLRLPGRLAAELEEYRDLYAQTHRHEIDLAALIEGILEQFLASDRFFQRRRSGGAMSPPSPSPDGRGA